MKKTTSLLMKLFLVVAVVALTAHLAQGQATTLGSISGTVTDPSGAVVPGASVTVTNESTGIARKVTTSNQGFYLVGGLGGGEYSVTVDRSGFTRMETQNIHLDPGQRRGVNISLHVGSVTTKVTVLANPVAVQTESSALGGTISGKEVENLMLNGRNFQTLALIVPGVSSVAGGGSLPQFGFGGYLGQTSVIVGGASVEKSQYIIDGVYDMEPSGLINVNVMPEIDSIAQFRILKDNYSARYGGAGSGQILVQTKSGGRTYHGTFYDYIRSNQFATARPFISSAPNTPLHYNIFGFSLGGPVQIPHLYNMNRNRKTYFFVASEFRVNHHYDGTHTRNMLPQAMRTGNFSGSPSMTNTTNCPNGKSPCLVLDAHSQMLLSKYRGVNPSTCITPDASGRYDQINPACMDPTAVALMNAYWPLPNDTGSTVNYINNGVDSDTQTDEVYRIDQAIGHNNELTGRWMWEEVDDVRPRNFNDPAPDPSSTVWSRGLNAMVRLTTTITPNLLNTAQAAETYSKFFLGVQNYALPSGASIAQQFPQADPLHRIPNIVIGGGGTWAWLGVGAQPNYNHTGEGILSDDVSWVKGAHLLQFGAVYFAGIRRANTNAFPMGLFIFSGQHTGDSAADYLLGLNSEYEQTSVQRSGVFHNRWGAVYAQDNWKATPRLMLDYGLRWSYYAPTTMSGAQVTNFDPSAWDADQAPVINLNGGETLNGANQPLTTSGTVANLSNGLVYAGKDGTPYGFVGGKSYFGPRVGFAWQATSDGKTSVHGGYGLGFTQVGYEQIANLISNPPFAQSTTITNSLLSTPTAGVAGAPPIPSLSVIVPKYFRATATSTYSLAVERQIGPNAVAQVAYAGSASQHVNPAGFDYNFPVSGTSPGTAGCAASGNNPASSSSPYGPYKGPAVSGTYEFDPCLNTGSVSSTYYRPYRGYTSATGPFAEGTANYNSLQSSLVYRSSNLQLNLAYTYSKSLTDVQPGNPGANGAGIGYDEAASPQNPHNMMADYGPPDFDRRHVFTAAWVYQLPFMEHAHNLLQRELLSGWSTAGLVVAESGFALNPSLSTSGAGLATRPNLVGPITSTGSGKPGTNTAFVSPSAFQPPAFGYFGDASPGVIRGPKDVTFNLAAYKTFPITKRVNTQLRAEAFNLFNHPNTVINSTWSGTNGGSFGQVIGAGDQRVMEFSARLNF